MAYRPPQLKIYQEFEQALISGAEPLYAVIVGPNYELHRFSEEDERALIGPYDRDAFIEEVQEREKQVAYTEQMFVKLIKGDDHYIGQLSTIELERTLLVLV